MLIDSGLSGNIAFTPVEVAPVEKMVSPEIEKIESSLKSFVDEYNNNVTNAEEGNTEDSTSGKILQTVEVKKK